MTRRTLLQSFAAVIPAGAGASARIELEPKINAGDLVVVTFPGPLRPETAHRIREHFERLLDAGVMTVVLAEGGTVHVHRGVAKVITPDGGTLR